MQNSSRHIPVLPREVIAGLGADVAGTYLDCTLGGGGHTLEILKSCAENKVFACDRDLRAIKRTERRLAEFSSRLKIFHTSFGSLDQVLDESTEYSEIKFDGILADLGLSSDQIEEDRGFSFKDAHSLDMRMNEAGGQTAEEFLNTASEQAIFVALKEGGVGSEARRVAKALVKGRPINSASQFATLVSQAVPKALQKSGIHPATVIFQAIRIKINDELEELRSLLKWIPSRINSGGKVAIISFHSLEDKLTAQVMRRWEQGSSKPALWPGNASKEDNAPRRGRLITKKALTPALSEIEANVRSRSAKLRIFEFF